MEEKILDSYIIIKKSKLNSFNDDLCKLADFCFIAKNILKENKFPMKAYKGYCRRTKKMV